MMTSTGKSLVPLLAVAGLILAAGFILYQAGFRVTTATPPAGKQQKNEPGGRHQNRNARGGGKTAAEIQSGMLGAEQIVVNANGTQSHFTGADLEKLKQTTVASNRGARAGWRIADVMNHLSIAQAKTLTVVTKDGKSTDIPWEKLTASDPMLILAYNRFGGLMLVSGKVLTPDELQQGVDRRTVKTVAAEQNQADRLFLANIVKFEVKS
jgi:hypothetical protein